MIGRRGLLAGLLATLVLAGPARGLDRAAARAIGVTAHPFDHFSGREKDRRVFGRLVFLGGLELRANDREFGGISGAVIDPDGKGFIAVSDHAHFISGRFVEEGGKLVGVTDMRIAPMFVPDGRRMKQTWYYDSESLTRKGRTLFVGVERAHVILQFEPGPRGYSRAARIIDLPPEFKRLDVNRGIEGLGVLPPRSAYAGQLIALAERAPKGRKDRNNPGLILGPGGGTLSVRKIGDFDITDLAFHPDGDMLILERRFEPLLGLAFRIRRIPLAAIRPGAVLDGEVLIEADFAHQIDNMEAITAHRGPDGRTVITLFSDDNFSLLQRNLVLRFAIDE